MHFGAKLLGLSDTVQSNGSVDPTDTMRSRETGGKQETWKSKTHCCHEMTHIGIIAV